MIRHGYEEAGRTGDIRIEAKVEPEALVVSMEDSGVPFDPTSAKPPDTLDAPLEDRPIGGLGIYLTVRGVDDFAYERRDEKNVNVFVMRRPDGQANGGAS